MRAVQAVNGSCETDSIFLASPLPAPEVCANRYGIIGFRKLKRFVHAFAPTQAAKQP